MFWNYAWAQEAGAQAAAGPSLMEQLFPFVLVFIVAYLFLLRPQQKRMQDQEKVRGALKRGDSVLTSGGILGTIEGLTESFVTLQIANGVKIKVLKSAIAGPASEELEKK
jgi:preprotein translocase subunit YajC